MKPTQLDLNAALLSRLDDVRSMMAEYDPEDPDFEDTYSEGYYDRLCDEYTFLLAVTEMENSYA